MQLLLLKGNWLRGLKFGLKEPSSRASSGVPVKSTKVDRRGGRNSKEKQPSPAGGVPGGVPGGVKGEQGGEYRPVKSEKMDGSKRWLEFKRRPSPAEAGAEGRATGVTGDAKPA